MSAHGTPTPFLLHISPTLQTRHGSMDFQLTIRFGGSRARYHMERRSADSMADLLEGLPEGIPQEVLDDADLMEIRPVVDPDRREYME